MKTREIYRKGIPAGTHLSVEKTPASVGRIPDGVRPVRSVAVSTDRYSPTGIIRLAILLSLSVINYQLSFAQTQSAPEPEWLEPIAPGFDTVARDPVEYGRLLDKFSEGVVWMSARECAIVYWGFPMQPGFTPDLAGEDDMHRAIMAEDYAAAYALGTEILRRAPVNLTALYWTLFAATETRQSWEVRNSLRGRYNNISAIISLSGDGVSPSSSFKVAWKSDMYTYTMLELGLDIGDGFVWDDRWTEFEVTPGGRFNHTSIFYELWSGR